MYLLDKHIKHNLEWRKKVEIIISNNANKPIYEQITSQIKAMIMSGELQPGESIPSMRALARSIHVSVITVQIPQSAGAVLWRRRTKNYIRRSSSGLQRSIYRPPLKLAGRAVYRWRD